ncbi:MAG: extradiol ring-cleavage dioxygenase [Chloroflexi bacterium]|nr:extradiol ring-cleavage dioxygenase [Chloroflexota bacterium]
MVGQGNHNSRDAGINRLAEALAGAELDALVILGDDQAEMHLDDNRPAIMVYWGENFTNGAINITPNMPEFRRASAWGWSEPDGERSYPVASNLGLHVIEHLREAEFDVAHSNRMPEHRSHMGHAFSYVHRRIMQENIIPTIPIMVNTYYPPNQPTLNRCYQLGRQVRAAVESMSEDVRVGVIASGGLSHFVIDEEIDGITMKALREGDSEALLSMPRERMNSGTSEIRNWIAMAGATEHLDHQWSDYVPSYRSLAGTGCAMGFGIWS